MDRIKAENYAADMKDKVRPFLAGRKESGFWGRTPGQKLYFEHFRADEPKGSVVMVHGFTEAIEKFYETAYYFVSSGYHVWLHQQREHGKSFRSTEDPALINIDNYGDLILDLHAFVTKKVKKDPGTNGLPLYVYAHSMGGGVGGCYLERYPDVFDKAILSSPMMEISSGSTPVWAAVGFAKTMIRAGKGKDYMPGAAPFSGEPDFKNSCSNCRERYDYWFRIQKEHPEYQMCVSAICTAYEFLRITKEVTSPKNCSRVKTPVLLFQAGRDHVVMPGGQDKFISQIGRFGKKVVLPEAKHEIYMGRDEDLEVYWEEIFDFLG